MVLTVNEHYAASAAYFMGGMLTLVCNLWLLLELLPTLKLKKAQKRLHQHLTLANILVVSFFFVGAVTHFEQKWYFGTNMCKFYVFINKFSCVLAMYMLAVCCYAEHCYTKNPHTDSSFNSLVFLSYAVAFFMGVGSITWAKYGQEPAGFTCTVLWYEHQPYVDVLTAFGAALPCTVAFYYSYQLYKSGNTKIFKMAQICDYLCITIPVQYSAYALGYIFVCMGYRIPLRVMALVPIWTKASGVVHPFVYSYTLGSDGSEAPARTKSTESVKKED